MYHSETFTTCIQFIVSRLNYSCILILLAGYSFGGVVAYEMASELKRKNETVAMVFMVDTYSWFPKDLPHHSEYIGKYTEKNLKKMETSTVSCILAFSLSPF